MLLKENENYLYFAKADLIENTLPAKVSTVTVFASKELLFCIPIKEFRSYLLLQRSKRFNHFEGVKPAVGLRALLNEEGLSLAEAEDRLLEMQKADKSCIAFAIPKLDQFKISPGLLGQALILHPKGKNRFQLMIKGRKARKDLRKFYGV